MKLDALVFAMQLLGSAHVIDGDTIVVEHRTVRLKGIDCAERGTVLGNAAAAYLRSRIEGQVVLCKLTTEKTHGRNVGICFGPDGKDLNAELVSAGQCLSCPRYLEDYTMLEREKLRAQQPRSSYCIQR
jgi:endonuclease YncB( thermonuclease family)